MTEKNISTKTVPTWCPGCYNFMILAGVKNFLAKKKDLDKYAIVTGIGCHAKIFDYLNLPGINGLHGRVPPTALGMKVAKPDMKLIGFSGDGDAYSEGLSHTINAARYNADWTYLIHNNQVFALTVGEPTPVTEKGFKDKAMPLGVKTEPLNPVKLMLSAGAGFVARVYADVKQIEWILEEAEKHKGFKYIEVIQPCIIFHKNIGYKEKTYMLAEKGHDKTNWDEAMKRANEFNYDTLNAETKIPLGIFYQMEKPVYEDGLKR